MTGYAPNSLGFVAVPVPGTPVALNATMLGCYVLRLQPRKSSAVVNVGNVYIGNSTMNKATGAGVYAILSPEQVEGITISTIMQIIDISKWYVDADNANDAVLVGYQVPQ